MATQTMAYRLLAAADMLLEEGVRSSTFRRRAISTAYYAVFHSVDKLCADYVTRGAKRDSEVYNRAYRALDHAPLKNAFSQSPLRENPRLSKIGSAIVQLQTERHKADYMPPVKGLFTQDRARELVAMAREAIGEIEKLRSSRNDCRTLATSLLFKERKS
ncbi:MAG: hypothetical protein KDJ48_01835 [Nitratireductor sp.]|nr:hypothetical protein [Nitratireductor sp.]